jgi:GntR family transcriptional regulator/MocR family aminotransferase
MTPHKTIAVLGTITLDHTSSTPLYHQLYESLRRAILSKQLLGGTKLPSTRLLASELGISRNTVLNAFEQLMAEGYLETRRGSGTYVAHVSPDDLLEAPTDLLQAPASIRKRVQISQYGVRLLSAVTRMPGPLVPSVQGKPRAFRQGVPALDAFPHVIWRRLLGRCWRRSSYELLNYGSCRPLCEAIAAYLGSGRGVHCTAEQVMIVAGSQQGLDLAARVLLDPGDAAWIEDPGYPGAYGALLGAGAFVVPAPVDDEGLDVTAGVGRCPDARLAFVTPSHQFPLGVTMSLKRRLELLEWASRADAWILEDDYDSEYRYAGRPLAALQGLDRENRVIYLGTFSKVMFPALRLAYLVVPSDLVDTFYAARLFATMLPPLLEQAALAEFIAGGHFARHIRRMRALYAERQAALVSAAHHELAGLLDVQPAEAGMHLLGWLPDGVDDRVASQWAAAHGVDAFPLSTYSLEATHCGALLLGYTATNEQEIKDGVFSLARAFRNRRALS